MLYKNILLIDDDRDDAELFMEAVDLLNKNILLRWESSPQTALEGLRESDNLPELIFLDYNMPRINGLELLGALKNDARLKDIPVLMISTPSADYMKSKIGQQNILAYLTSPTVLAGCFPSWIRFCGHSHFDVSRQCKALRLKS
ncbi:MULTISPECIES: response regulator [Flavobacterium]|uniref:response regulator n=1 Tax=Flavobacterium TaxID=237 RepID=UPI0021159632|nr:MULTISPECIES: response regulator [Flavobacterium]UUF12397.1 response regulator [Flavobacterium panici]